jgi:peptidoglycan/xylan/chitin deacetylase (PgdA/CDA1 family)
VPRFVSDRAERVQYSAVRPRSNFVELLFGKGLSIALSVSLVAAAGLVVFGLARELTGARTTVVAAPRTLIASQVAAASLEDAARNDADDVEDVDPSADPHTEPTEMIVDAPSEAPGEVAEAPRPDEPSPEAAPEAAAEAAPSPSPAPVAARLRPAPGPRGAPRSTADVPIVMYHHVGPLPPNPDIFRKDLTVSPELFERTLTQLADREVETVTMADLMEHLAGGPELPKRAAILTFDDGYDDVYEHAFRALQKRGMVGTFFITTDFVERPGYVTWDQVKEMADAGMEIAAHSSNHADFAKIGPAELRRQLVEPKAVLEEHIGQKVKFVAYPAGKYNATVMAATRAAGYEAAVTVLHGTRHTPGLAFELRRVRARGADTAAEIVGRMTVASWRQ